MALWLIKHRTGADYDVVDAAVVRARSQDQAWALLWTAGSLHDREAYEFSQLLVAGPPEVIVVDIPDG